MSTAGQTYPLRASNDTRRLGGSLQDADLLLLAVKLNAGQLDDAVPADVHRATEDYPRDDRLVLLWLTRIRPSSRARYLQTLRSFLDWSGLCTPSAAVDAAGRDRTAVHEVLCKFTEHACVQRSDRLFAYAAVRSFLARARVPLPNEASFDPGGATDEWWVSAGRDQRDLGEQR